MKSPAMSLAYRGDEVFLEFEGVSFRIAGSYDADKVRNGLKAQNVPVETIDRAIEFLEVTRNHFQRPDPLADPIRAAA